MCSTITREERRMGNCREKRARVSGLAGEGVLTVEGRCFNLPERHTRQRCADAGKIAPSRM